MGIGKRSKGRRQRPQIHRRGAVGHRRSRRQCHQDSTPGRAAGEETFRRQPPRAKQRASWQGPRQAPPGEGPAIAITPPTSGRLTPPLLAPVIAQHSRLPPTISPFKSTPAQRSPPHPTPTALLSPIRLLCSPPRPCPPLLCHTRVRAQHDDKLHPPQRQPVHRVVVEDHPARGHCRLEPVCDSVLVEEVALAGGVPAVVRPVGAGGGVGASVEVGEADGGRNGGGGGRLAWGEGGRGGEGEEKGQEKERGGHRKKTKSYGGGLGGGDRNGRGDTSSLTRRVSGCCQNGTAVAVCT